MNPVGQHYLMTQMVLYLFTIPTNQTMPKSLINGKQTLVDWIVNFKF
jgi:hypothetical protein